MSTHHHVPVMQESVMQGLAIQPDGIYIDATFGRGGHAHAVLSRLEAKGRLLAIDKDPQAVAHARAQFSDDTRFSCHRMDHADIARLCDEQNLTGLVQGVLFDLGVSSPQIDDPTRGFSFMHDAPLDMRMDPSCGVSAQEWLASASEAEIARVFFEYGEERYSRRIARALVKQRQVEQIQTTVQLADLVRANQPRQDKHKHPATRVFQAIRIHINRELTSLEGALRGALEVLAVNGRLVVLSFHSLEDRIVKRFIRGDHCRPVLPANLPVQHQAVHWPVRRLGSVLFPSPAELLANPRARSARLRVAEKLAS